MNPAPSRPRRSIGFQGRARELYELERRFRTHRGIVLHAMGGMGKTALATEAAHWWTRSGLFRDGACFLSFEQFASADRVVQVLGTYLAGPKFDQLPAAEQRRRAIELFQQKDVLLVWDNFESALPQFNDGAATHGSPYTDDERRRLAELFRDLTTGTGKGCLLVTCRPGDTGLPGALAVRAARPGPRRQPVAARAHPEARRPHARRSTAEPRQARSAAARSGRSPALAGARRPPPAHPHARGDPRGLRQAPREVPAGGPRGEKPVPARLAGVLPPPPQPRRPRGPALARPLQRRGVREQAARREPARPGGLGTDPAGAARHRPPARGGRHPDRRPSLPALPPHARLRRRRSNPRAEPGDPAALHRRLSCPHAGAGQGAERARNRAPLWKS